MCARDDVHFSATLLASKPFLFLFNRKIRQSNTEPRHLRDGTPWRYNGIPYSTDVALVRLSRKHLTYSKPIDPLCLWRAWTERHSVQNHEDLNTWHNSERFSQRGCAIRVIFSDLGSPLSPSLLHSRPTGRATPGRPHWPSRCKGRGQLACHRKRRSRSRDAVRITCAGHGSRPIAAAPALAISPSSSRGALLRRLTE